MYYFKYNNIMSKKDRIIKLIIFISILILIISSVISTKLTGGDEIWNYSFSNNFLNGLIPYKDFNVIITPFSFIFTSIFLAIKNTLFTYRIMSILYYIIMLLLLDLVLTKLKIKDIWKYTSILIITLCLLGVGYVEYNFIQDIFILLIIYLLLINKNYKNKKLNIIIPILVGLTITNKQNTGVYIAISYLLLMFPKKIKDYKFVIKELLLICVPILVLFLYLLINNALYDFIDMCVLGISTFKGGNSNPSLIFILIVFLDFMIYTFIKNKKDISHRILFIFGISSMLVSYPIFDYNHVIIGLIIPIIYVVNHLNKKMIDIKYQWFLLVVPFLLIISFININNYRNSYIIKDGVYKYIPTDKIVDENIKVISNYINNSDKKVFIITGDGAIYKISAGKYDKYFDLFNEGNFGYHGIKKVYNVIDNEDNLFMIDDNTLIWTTPKEIVKHIKETYHECDKVRAFTVYCKNKN